MLDDFKRLRLAGLASTSNQGYSPASPGKAAGPGMHEPNEMSHGTATLPAIVPAWDRA